MGKKKITYLLLFMLLGVNANSQQLFTVKLCWKEKKEALAYLYQITYDLANDTSPVFVQYNKFNFRDMNFTDLVNKIFKKKEVDTQLTLIKQTIQKKAKKHLNENFFFAKDTVTNFGFNNEEKIMEWGKSFGSFTHINSREFHIKGTDIFILMVDECSGIS